MNRLAPTGRIAVGAAIAVLITAFLVGCGGSSDGRDGGDASTGSADARGGTVTVKHRFGTTQVPVRPGRIVSLDAQWTDVLLALGAPPVGYIRDYNLKDGSFPWRGDRLARATAISATNALPYEQIAALRPDLIVVAYFAQDEGDYQKLTAIAPTITSLGASEVDSWQDITRTAGRVLDEPKRAEAVIDRVEGQVRATTAELPGLHGKTFALVNYVPGDALYVVADPDDGSVALFKQLGLSLPPAILDAGRGGPSRVQLSLERGQMLDADVLIVFPNGGDPEDIVGYDSLPAVKAGAVAVLDYASVSGLNTPSPLSVPYSLKLIRPALGAAVG